MPHGYSREKLERIGSKWLQRIIAAEKRERDWRKDAEAAEKAYTNDENLDGKQYDFNVLHANVETIVPAIYNSTPVPDIRRRFQDDDPVAKQVADILERAISTQIDDSRLDKEMESGAQGAFLAGRDVIRLRFDADWEDDTPAERVGLADEEEKAEAEDEAPEVMGPVLRAGSERILFEAVSWRDFRMGPAKRWEDVSWIAFRHHIPEEEVERLTDKDLMDLQRGPDEHTLDGKDEEDIQVWEIWCKSTRTVKFIRDSDRKVLRIEDDPLELEDFFPVAAPIQPITITGRMTPVCPFSIYRRLADEVDLITKRIIKITGVMKVKGVSYGEAGDLQEFAEAGDGEIVIGRNLEQLAQTKGVSDAISWWPVEPMATALAQLYLNREQTKQAIYEITGISDIVRGASDARETLGAQEIKTQWGSLRIQKMQRMLERQVRDIFVLMAEIISKHFSTETLQEMTGIQIAPEVDALLRDNVRLHYRIDVESDSTVRADLSRMRGEMSAFLAGTGAFFNAVGPVVQQKPELSEPMAEIYGAFARQFRLGKQAEDALERMSSEAKEPREEQPNPEAQKAQMEAQKMQAQLQMDQQKLQLEQQRAALDAQAQQRQQQLEMRKADLEGEIRRQEAGLNAEKVRTEIRKIEAEIARIVAQVEAARQSKEEAA